jgi:tripartite-type tricarboxylate transporter receptor subunit TctC
LGSIPVTPIPPLALITRIPFVLVVNPSLPVHSVTDLMRSPRRDPGRLSYASGGPSSPHHLFTELFKNMTGITMLLNAHRILALRRLLHSARLPCRPQLLRPA